MNTFFQISGMIFWAVAALVALYFGIPYIVKGFKRYISTPLGNLKFYMFGARWTKRHNMAEVYFSRYQGRPGILEHWHSWEGFRSLAYYRFLKEAHKDMPEYLEKLRNNQ